MIFWLMYTTKITIIYIYEKLLFLLVTDVTKKEKEELYLLKIHTKGFLFMYFLSTIHKNTMRNASNEYHLLVNVHYENYHNYHQTKNYYCLLVEDVMNK